MIEMGLIVGIGLLVTLAKMNWKWRMRCLSYPLAMDALIFIALFLLHSGTYSGVMVATIGALVCSLVLSMGRKLYGHVDAGVYTVGVFNVSHHLPGVVVRMAQESNV